MKTYFVPVFVTVDAPDADEADRLAGERIGGFGVLSAGPHAWKASADLSEGCPTAESGADGANPYAAALAALRALLDAAEGITAPWGAYGVSITDPDHPWHESVMTARAALASIDRA